MSDGLWSAGKGGGRDMQFRVQALCRFPASPSRTSGAGTWRRNWERLGFSGRCVAQGRDWLHESLGSQVELGTLGGRGPGPVAEAEGGAHCCEVLGVPGRLHPLPAPPPLSSAQAKLLGTELGASAGSAFPPAASSRATLVSPWPSERASSVTRG